MVVQGCSPLGWVQWLGVPLLEGKSRPSPLYWYHHEKALLET